MSNTNQKLKYSIQRVLNKSVMTMARKDWESLVREDGILTEVSSLGPPFEKVMEEANIVAATAAGFNCNTPGIEFVRFDQKDAPYIYNIDNYTVVQSFQSHDQYYNVVNMAGLQDSKDLQVCLSETVFIIKQNPNEISDHRSKEIPERIKKALKKQYTKC